MFARVDLNKEKMMTIDFKNFFKLKQDEDKLGFVNIPLNTDVVLYIDPLVLRNQKGAWFAEANNLIVDFIKRYPERCFIITGNIDIWIEDLIVELGMKEHTYCSKANYIGDKLTQVVNIVDKELVAKQFIQPLVVIGDGANDSGMAKVADI